MIRWFPMPAEVVQAHLATTGAYTEPASEMMALLEYGFISTSGHSTFWTERRLAERWGWSKSRVHRLVLNYTSIVQKRADQKWTKNGPESDQDWTTSEPEADQDRTKTISSGAGSGVSSGPESVKSEPTPDQEWTANDAQKSLARALDPYTLTKNNLQGTLQGETIIQQHPPVALSGDCELTQEKPRAEEAPQQMTLGIQAQVHLPVASVKTPTSAAKRKKNREPLLELKELTAEMRARVEPALERLLKAQRIGIRVETGERLDLDNPVYWLQQMAETYPHLDLANEIGRADSWLVAKREVRAKPRVWFCTVWLPRARPADHAQHAQSLPMNGQPTLDDLIAAGRSARRENRSSEFGRVYGRLWGKSPLPLVYATTVDHEPGARDCPCWGCLHQLGWWPGPRAWTDRPVSGDDPRAMQGGHTPTAGQYQADDEPWFDELA